MKTPLSNGLMSYFSFSFNMATKSTIDLWNKFKLVFIDAKYYLCNGVVKSSLFHASFQCYTDVLFLTQVNSVIKSNFSDKKIVFVTHLSDIMNSHIYFLSL